ncbi:hypothetical protein L227DRAFT_631152, partial [Lentinus tigrinus ALCF2SS1-6]
MSLAHPKRRYESTSGTTSSTRTCSFPTPSSSSPPEKLALFGAATDWLDGLNKQLDDWDSQSYISGFHQLCVKDKMTELGWPTRDYIAQIARFDPSKGISIVIDSYVCFRKLLTEKEPSGEPQQMLICGHG